MNYEFKGYQPCQVRRMDILVASDPIGIGFGGV